MGSVKTSSVILLVSNLLLYLHGKRMLFVTKFAFDHPSSALNYWCTDWQESSKNFRAENILAAETIFAVLTYPIIHSSSFFISCYPGNISESKVKIHFVLIKRSLLEHGSASN